MQEEPLISIIIPTFNRGYLIMETLESLVAQTYSHFECIIVDDGSTDNTEEVVAPLLAIDKRFRYFQRPSNIPKGPNSCRNFGLVKSKGDWVKWFDSDDIFFHNTLESFVSFLDESLDLVVSKLQLIDMESKLILKENIIISDNLIEDYFIGKIAFYVCGPMWNKDFLLKQVELFDESITNLDDWDFNLRMLYQNPKIEFINTALIQYRIHSESLAHEINKLNYTEIQSELNAREKHLQLISENKKADTRVLNTFIKDRCKYFFREAIIKRDQKRYYYLKLLLKKQLLLNDYSGIIKTLFGLIVYGVFNKGYKLLK